MTDTEHQPEENSGGLTGATGSLTAAGSEEPFVPAERREIEDPQAQPPPAEDDEPEGG